MHRGGADETADLGIPRVHETEADDGSGQFSHVDDDAYSVAENGCVPVLHVRAGVQRYGVCRSGVSPLGQNELASLMVIWRRSRGSPSTHTKVVPAATGTVVADGGQPSLAAGGLAAIPRLGEVASCRCSRFMSSTAQPFALAWS